jgi:hypothetical protein
MSHSNYIPNCGTRFVSMCMEGRLASIGFLRTFWAVARLKEKSDMDCQKGTMLFGSANGIGPGKFRAKLLEDMSEFALNGQIWPRQCHSIRRGGRTCYPGIPQGPSLQD